MSPTTGPPATVSVERFIEPWLDDLFPDYDAEPPVVSVVESFTCHSDDFMSRRFEKERGNAPCALYAVA
jgi:hypothetical protein